MYSMACGHCDISSVFECELPCRAEKLRWMKRRKKLIVCQRSSPTTLEFNGQRVKYHVSKWTPRNIGLHSAVICSSSPASSAIDRTDVSATEPFDAKRRLTHLYSRAATTQAVPLALRRTRGSIYRMPVMIYSCYKTLVVVWTAALMTSSMRRNR